MSLGDAETVAAVVAEVAARLVQRYCGFGFDCQYPPGAIFVCVSCATGAIAPNTTGEADPSVIVGNSCPDCAESGDEMRGWEAWLALRAGEHFSLSRSAEEEKA